MEGSIWCPLLSIDHDIMSEGGACASVPSWADTDPIVTDFRLHGLTWSYMTDYMEPQVLLNNHSDLLSQERPLHGCKTESSCFSDKVRLARQLFLTDKPGCSLTDTGSGEGGLPVRLSVQFNRHRFW